MQSLASLGARIIIVGPSNSGKSTLAFSIGEKLGLPTVHLDQLRHLPNTNWVDRSDAEFAKLHDAAIMQENWVIEGNYSNLLPQRLDRASGIILLDSNVWLRLFRYLRRSFKSSTDRNGQLEGVNDKLNWKMIYMILIKTRNKGGRYAKIAESSGKPVIKCGSASELNQLYRGWSLPLQ